MTPDILVVGGGISGLAFAFKASQAGKRVLVLERGAAAGGCLRSVRSGDGFWYELGGHTVYNSYGGFLDMAVGTGVAKTLVERGPARATFGLLRDGKYKWLSPPKVLRELSWLEVLTHAPVGVFRSKAGQTMRSHFSRLIGPKNYDRVLAPFLAAVPSQSADGFPAEGDGSLFKTRPRRKEFPRSFGIPGGLQTVCDAVAAAPGVTVETGAPATRLTRTAGGLSVETGDGRVLSAPIVALAVAPAVAAALLAESEPGLAATLGRVKDVAVESMGVVVPREAVWMPECAFLVPVNDAFHSAVTRDPFPDERRRAFTFHFKPGLSRADKIARIAEVLRLAPDALGEPAESRVTLPSPELGHGEIVKDLDRQLAGTKLALTGNYFAGLAIEDCVQRSFSEWARVTA